MSNIGGCSTCHTSSGLAALSRALYEQQSNALEKVAKQSDPGDQTVNQQPSTTATAGHLINDYA